MAYREAKVGVYFLFCFFGRRRRENRTILRTGFRFYNIIIIIILIIGIGFCVTTYTVYNNIADGTSWKLQRRATPCSTARVYTLLIYVGII